MSDYSLKEVVIELRKINDNLFFIRQELENINNREELESINKEKV